MPNVCGVVITSNHKEGIYLPADDRRFFVAETELTQDDWPADYVDTLYAWLEKDGYAHVAAYL